MVKLFSHDSSISSSSRKVIWVIQGVFLSSGGLLLFFNSYFKTTLKHLLFSFVTIVLIFLLLEGTVRGFYMIKNKINGKPRTHSEYLGWKTVDNISSNNEVKGYGKINYSTTIHGFRRFGDVDSEKVKIFVVGDSYTQAYNVDDDSTYYDFIENNHNEVEMFAYGCSGYGSLQEYMIIDKYMDSINPDLILWQFCSNDVINNVHEFESSSIIDNNLMTRPYLEDGEIVYKFPTPNLFMHRVLQSSYLLKFLNIRMRLLYGIIAPQTIENKLTKEHPLLVEGKSVTIEILTLLKERCGEIPILAFNMDRPEWLGETYNEVCASTGIIFLDNIPDIILTAQEAGIKVTGLPHNVHFNNTGNSIIGNHILNYLLAEGLIEKIQSREN
ncbi:MAG: SGNH/GDSL hydrolase family protein [Bacteroidetes bacterium]|nr:SGNH/GDSL hydrolase family protein [Bacteroidota bacterium]